MIVGVDEVGSGALAGPVLAGAVVLPIASGLGGIADSKVLSTRQREELYVLICEKATAWAVGSASVQEIFDLGIRPSTYLAMRRAVDHIESVDYVLVDAWTIPGLSIPQHGIICGDRLTKSIAAGSIIAKVTRDRQMSELAMQYPQYGFEKHKGYATQMHKRAILEYGPCAIHRMNYKPLQIASITQNLKTFDRGVS